MVRVLEADAIKQDGFAEWGERRRAGHELGTRRAAVPAEQRLQHVVGAALLDLFARDRLRGQPVGAARFEIGEPIGGSVGAHGEGIERGRCHRIERELQGVAARHELGGDGAFHIAYPSQMHGGDAGFEIADRGLAEAVRAHLDLTTGDRAHHGQHVAKRSFLGVVRAQEQ